MEPSPSPMLGVQLHGHDGALVCYGDRLMRYAPYVRQKALNLLDAESLATVCRDDVIVDLGGHEKRDLSLQR